MNRRYRIAVDMDEVIADSFRAQWNWYQETHGYNWTAERLHGKECRELADPEHVAIMDNMLQEGSFFRTLEVIPGSQKALTLLSSDYEIFITTAAMEFPASCIFKFGWLREHFPFVPPLNFVFCGDKSVVAADFLIDDHVHHFRRFRGQGILFSASHNMNVNWSPRLANWNEAVELLDGMVRGELEAVS